MELRILGPLEVWEGSEQLAIDSPRQRTLLALLAINANEVVSADRIADELWGDEPPGSPQSTLRYHMSKLRASLGDAAVHVVTRSPGYVLELDTENIDMQRFATMVAEGRKLIAEEPERAAGLLADALSMWRGAPLADFTYESFARSEIVRLEELRLAVLEDRIEADLGSGRHRKLVGELEGLVEEYPLRERLWGQLMQALYGAGRQVEALRAFQSARHALAEAGIEPSEELRAMEERVLQQDPRLLPLRLPLRRHNLPGRISSFVGRRREVVELLGLMGRHRLVTLTGIGGIGKSSVAVEAAREIIDAYGDGVWLVGVADVPDPSVVTERVAGVLGLPTQPAAGLLERLSEYLVSRTTMLILDGCERHVDAAANLAEVLLGAAPQLHILATSREPLEVPGECRLEIPPLPTEGTESDAFQLFVDRAALVQRRFSVTDENSGAIAEICRRVAGIPLAIELAAARLSVMNLDEISQRMDDQLRLLTHGRRSDSHHGSLRAVLDWSHGLLDPREKILFRRLSVFQGGAALPAIERVCADSSLSSEEILDVLAHLVEVSLLVKDAEANRVEMLDPVRQYAAQHLTTAGEEQGLRCRHAAYYRDVSRDLFDAEFSPAEVERAEMRLREESNLINALSWALGSAEPLAVEMGACLAGRLLFVDNLLGPLLEIARREPSRELVILLTHAAFLQVGSEDLSLAEEAVAVAKDLDDEYALGRALTRLGAMIGWGRDFRRGVEVTRQALDLFNQMGHPEAMRCLLNLAGMLVRMEDGLDEAECAARELERLAAESGSTTHLALAHQALSWVAVSRGELEEARAHLKAALVMHAEVRDYRWVAMVLAWLIELELAAGNIEQAVIYHEDLGSEFREFWGGVFVSTDALVRLASGDVAGGIALLLDELERFADSSEIEVEIALRRLAGACQAAGRSATAVRLHARAKKIRERRHLGLAKHETERVEADQARLRAQLGSTAFRSEWRQGGDMTIDDIVAYARASLGPATVGQPRPR